MLLCVSVAVVWYMHSRGRVWFYTSDIHNCGKYRIMGSGVASEKTMFDYVKRYNPQISDQKLKYIIKTYVWESRYEGVNHDVAFANMCHETNFLKFGGSIDERQNNFNGLGTMSHDVWAWFYTMRDGIRAHVQHLKAYGSRLPLNNERVDPRFDIVERGVSKDIYGLGGHWAPNYGKAIEMKMNAMLTAQ
ncbi:MAG: glucosaminidase domain-containing protein [Puniceicoccales bacterium]|nr:glucosaminidase domain-containing protein [Puniceicoccales bacterium]